MQQRDKNIFIITIFAVLLLITWTLSQYISTKKTKSEMVEIKDSKKVTSEQDNFDNRSKSLKTEIPLISATELSQKILADKNILIIDNRSVESFRAGHIANSIHISELDTIRPERTVVFITDTGSEQSILQYTNNLSSDDNLFNLRNGFNSWVNEGHTVISQKIEKNFLNMSKVTFLEPRDLDALLKDLSKEELVIDTRRKGNYDKSHVPGSINMPFEEIELRHKEIPLSTKIFLYGVDENSSFESGVLFYDLGHIYANVIKGGFNAWTEYGYPLSQ